MGDATGRMKVRLYATGAGSIDVAGLERGRYVSVVGNLRTSPSAHISAMCLQPVESADEVSYHMISVAHAALRLRNPSKASPMAVTPPKQTADVGLGLGNEGNKLPPAKIEPPVFAGFGEPAPPAQPAQPQDLRSAVVDELRKAQ